MTPYLDNHRHLWREDFKTGCLLWIGATAGSKGKRPQAKIYGEKRYVAQFVCEEANGPCPDGMETCHNCMNGMCVNDAHVRWDTHDNNMLDTRWVT